MRALRPVPIMRIGNVRAGEARNQSLGRLQIPSMNSRLFQVGRELGNRHNEKVAAAKALDMESGQNGDDVRFPRLRYLSMAKSTLKKKGIQV